jgi:hypothetical protein
MAICDNIVELNEKLYKKNIGQYLKFLDEEELNLSDAELRTLLSNASILSLSDIVAERFSAYEICSRIVELYGSKKEFVLPATDIILSRIGNFPGRTLLREKYLSDDAPHVPFFLALERLARESENTLGEAALLTDFQYKLYTSLESEQSMSVSAPTSAGKSFVLNLDLIRRLGKDKSPCIVYVVPTRALVSEVVSRIRSTLRTEGVEGIAVRTAPFPVSKNENVKGIAYVLTQERLLRLLSTKPREVEITSLIVDEAHELQKGKRGILLQNSIDLALQKFPNASIFFASPLIKNPGYLLNVFKRNSNGKFFTEEMSPVSQNVMLISEVSRKPKLVDVKILSNKESKNIGHASLTFNFRGSKIEQKARFAAEICGVGESVILFADDASMAEESARVIAAVQGDFAISEEIRDFIHFIHSEIHPEYALIDCLQKGVAFHYGNMPSIVRSGVERLFKAGELRFLCSTSTLLQGVNLPAKHIVIQNPHLGEHAMGRADFRNLAGRAGRLLKEFHGNVWCLRPGEWQNDCYQGDDLQEISSAMDKVMGDGGTVIGALTEGFAGTTDDELADAAFSRLYYEVSHDGPGEAFGKYQNDSNHEILRSNVDFMVGLKVDLPSEILESHRSLRPDLLQQLFSNLRAAPHLENAILHNPHERGGKLRMQYAIHAINNAFGIVMEDKFFNFVSGIAHNWVWGKPIGEMISERLSFLRERRPNLPASPEIRALLKIIETEVRYKLVKYFAAYEDVLRLALDERKISTEQPAIAPYHIYLEFGASDPVSLSLMTLGFSRFTAIKLQKAIKWTDERDVEDYMRTMKRVNIASLKLPQLCRQEINEILGYS